MWYIVPSSKRSPLKRELHICFLATSFAKPRLLFTVQFALRDDKCFRGPDKSDSTCFSPTFDSLRRSAHLCAQTPYCSLCSTARLPMCPGPRAANVLPHGCADEHISEVSFVSFAKFAFMAVAAMHAAVGRKRHRHTADSMEHSHDEICGHERCRRSCYSTACSARVSKYCAQSTVPGLAMV
jgi:hypothetical protein